MKKEDFRSDSCGRVRDTASWRDAAGHHSVVKRRSGRIIAPVTILAVLALLFVAKLPYLLAFERGVQGYLYGYPLISMNLTRQVMTAPQATWGAHPKFAAGAVNQITNIGEFPDPAFMDVVAPNADTLYSSAWLDLKAEPLVLSMPDMHGRWVLMEVLDAWSNAYASLGTRQYGSGSRQYLIAGPDWTGTVPVGMVRIKSPSNMAWIIGRTYTRDAADFPAVHQLQAEYRLTPLSAFLNQPIRRAPVREAGGTVDPRTPVVTQVAGLGARAFFANLALLMASNPPPSADVRIVDVLAKLGIVAGHPLAWDQLDTATREGLEDAVWFVRALFEARSPGTQGPTDTNRVQEAFFRWINSAMSKSLLNSHDGWMIPLNLGRYGTNYALRAMVTLVGLGANVPEDVVYPSTFVDADGKQLDGESRYRLHFERNQLPPAKTFWSLTMYDSKGLFVENPIGRYAIGGRNDLRYNSDGSLDLWIQHVQPDRDKTTNWLPAPSGNFKVYLRLYDPKTKVLENRWIPPAVRRIE
ncbi:hypothetical protein WL93_00075 [Burkholderia diffusa]|uniref:DUF1254 domain-containing protein n=1 Tax=Burkholderia diffusa TaxID=488732 RepID=UPI000758E69A|nr:DUF1254 domain-containing protein [Burkholderia diffusa]KWF95446.1 hypothetical protein WL93_00075 [Burkholderia diffusa]